MVTAVALAVPAAAQTQDVQSRVVTNQVAVQEVAADALAMWKTDYPKALEAARRLQSSDRTRELGEQLEADLQAYNEALQAYRRVSERLRHKDRAMTASIDELKSAEGASSRTYQTISNVMETGHEAVKSMINNIR